MWQKAHPIGLRVGITKSWPSERFARDDKQYADFIVEDELIRRLIDDFYTNSGITKVVIRKTAQTGEILIFSVKVGAIMGKNGDKLKKFEEKLKKVSQKEFKITVKEVRTPEFSARVMAEFIASQLENRMPYRKVAKNVIEKVMAKGADGVKVQIAGRLGGQDIARTEKFIQGRISLQTFRADIDYHYLQARTKYGVLGIKVRIAKGSVFQSEKKKVQLNID